MKFIKKIFAVVLTCATLFSFVACDLQGKSAYEIAVKNGFVGTEREWLNSLQGNSGKDGDDFDIRDIYAQSGYEGSFEEFLREYLSDSDVVLNENNNTKQIAQNIMSVVKVNAFNTTKSSGGGVSTGSGVIFNLNKEAGTAYVLTNYHVVYNAELPYEGAESWKQNIRVFLYGSKDYTTEAVGNAYQITSYGDGIPVRYIGGSIYYDLAILKIEGSEILKNSAATEVTFGSSDDSAIGEKVYAIGNPAGAGIAVTNGALSVLSEYITLKMQVRVKEGGLFGSFSVQDMYFDYRVMRTDAAINGGNSGGALFNADGELIGIVNAKTADESIDNMGYALPVSQVKKVVDNILANDGVMKRVMFGVTVSAASSKAEFNAKDEIVIKEAIQIAKVDEGSLAVGKFEVGDIIKTIKIGDSAEQAVDRTYKMVEYLFNARKGDTVVFKIERNGEEKIVEFLLNDDGYFKDYSPEYFKAQEK